VPSSRDHPFTVVFVCTGNRFRSPLAAALLRKAAPEDAIEVHSYGTLDVGPAPALRGAVEAGTRFGLSLDSHRAQAIMPGSLADADLVVGFERAHLVTAVMEGSAARERAFTLPEIVELLERTRVPEAPARDAIARAAALRSNPLLGIVPELQDPLGKSASVQRAIAEQIEQLTRRLARLLFP
jgi:protein-tyrosine phosphatase